MRVTTDSKARREKIRNLHLIEQKQYETCEKSKSRINEIFLRPPYSACGKENTK